MENQKRSVTFEDYLKLINEYTMYNGYSTLTDISNYLNIKRQSAYDEINLLINEGLVEREDKGHYILTKSGEKEANIFLRKHRIAEIILYDCLNISWNETDEQAMGIEHGITEVIENAVCKKYNCDKCPHGNPIPDKNGNVINIDDIKYKNLKNDKKYVISRVVFENKEILDFLSTNNILPDNIVIKKGDELISYNDVVIPEYISKAMRFKNI